MNTFKLPNTNLACQMECVFHLFEIYFHIHPGKCPYRKHLEKGGKAPKGVFVYHIQADQSSCSAPQCLTELLPQAVQSKGEQCCPPRKSFRTNSCYVLNSSASVAGMPLNFLSVKEVFKLIKNALLKIDKIDELDFRVEICVIQWSCNVSKTQ